MAIYETGQTERKKHKRTVAAIKQWKAKGLTIVETVEWYDDHLLCLTLRLSNGDELWWWYVDVKKLVTGYDGKGNLLDLVLKVVVAEADYLED